MTFQSLDDRTETIIVTDNAQDLIQRLVYYRCVICHRKYRDPARCVSHVVEVHHIEPTSQSTTV